MWNEYADRDICCVVWYDVIYVIWGEESGTFRTNMLWNCFLKSNNVHIEKFVEGVTEWCKITPTTFDKIPSGLKPICNFSVMTILDKLLLNARYKLFFFQI